MDTKSIDDYIGEAIRLLHSPSPDAAREMRKIVDFEILKNHSKTSTLNFRLSDKEMKNLRNLEKNAVGSGFIKRKLPKPIIIIESKLAATKLEPRKLTSPANSTTSSEISLKSIQPHHDIDASIASALLNELTCQICQNMESTSLNPLLECVSCNKLYHLKCQARTLNDPNAFLCNSCNPTGLIIKRKDMMSPKKKKIN